MKRYTFEIIIEEGNDEFWEGLIENGSTGCDELHDMIRDCLHGTGLQEDYGTTITLRSYTNKD